MVFAHFKCQAPRLSITDMACVSSGSSTHKAWRALAGPEVAPLQLMKDAVDRYPIAAWKCYTQWGPTGIGFELDSPGVGIPFIERARARARRAARLNPITARRRRTAGQVPM
jgi:hypothetical protein